MEYEYTEYDRITPPIERRYKRLSKAKGRVIIPLDVYGQDANGKMPVYVRDEEDQARDGKNIDAAGADSGSTVADSRAFGWLRGPGNE